LGGGGMEPIPLTTTTTTTTINDNNNNKIVWASSLILFVQIHYHYLEYKLEPVLCLAGYHVQRFEADSAQRAGNFYS
jgi:hypothetical protein